MRARDLMTEVWTVGSDESASELIRRFLRPGVRAVGVVARSGEVVGVVTEEDLLGALIPSYVLADEQLAGVLEETAGVHLRHRLERRRVEEIVDVTRRDRPLISPDDTLIEVASAMARSSASGLLVVEGGRAVGVITVDRLLAELLRP